ncbi:MAG: VOC family protein, partial [Longimicrobiales bacterium]
QPQCAASWYVTTLGMTLPPVRNDDGTTSPRELQQPCEAEVGPPGWPSLERLGTLRQPRATVVHENGSMSFYPRQCISGRCGADQALVPTRGQVLDHVGFSVADVDAWYAWLASQRVEIVEDVHDIAEGRAFMFEGPDGLAIEFVQLGSQGR